MTCHVGSLEKDFYFGTLNSFDLVFNQQVLYFMFGSVIYKHTINICRLYIIYRCIKYNHNNTCWVVQLVIKTTIVFFYYNCNYEFILMIA